MATVTRESRMLTRRSLALWVILCLGALTALDAAAAVKVREKVFGDVVHNVGHGAHDVRLRRRHLPRCGGRRRIHFRPRRARTETPVAELVACQPYLRFRTGQVLLLRRLRPFPPQGRRVDRFCVSILLKVYSFIFKYNISHILK